MQITSISGQVICEGEANTLRELVERTVCNGANLGYAYLNWNSPDLLVELLRRAAGEDVERLSLAGLVLLQRHWCWNDFLALHHPQQDWALGVLAGHVQEGDGAPECVRAAAVRAEVGR